MVWLIVSLWLITESDVVHITPIILLLRWTDSLARPPNPIVRRLSGRITTLMSARLPLMEALASSNMADMPLINLIGKSPLAAWRVALHQPTRQILYWSSSPAPTSWTGYVTNHFSKSGAQTLLWVCSSRVPLYNLFHKKPEHLPQWKSIMWVCVSYFCNALFTTLHLNTQMHAHTPK